MTERTAAGARPDGVRRRADAERNIAGILSTATDLLARHPDASMTDIAKAAGVGRVTLYAHFPSREELVRAVLVDVITRSTAVIDGAASDEGPPAEVFARLIRTSWQVLSRLSGLHQAAQHALPAEEVRRHHDPLMASVERLLARGRAAGDFRTDMTTEWLITTIYALLHAAAAEVHQGRLNPEAAGVLLETTLLAVLRTDG